MKYQEALQNFIDDRIDTIDRSESDYIPYTTTDDIDVLKEAIDKAQKYDELMTPKKVKVYPFVNTKGKYINESFCGSCDYYIDRIKYEKYCFNCGQALKWSNVND